MSKKSMKRAAQVAAAPTPAETPVVESTSTEVTVAAEAPANKGVAVKRWKAGSVLGDATLFGKTAKAQYPVDSTITILKASNPKRPGSTSAKRFAKYRDGMTIGEYCKAIDSDSVGYADIAWDVNHGFISVAMPNVEELEVMDANDAIRESEAAEFEQLENQAA
jgi:hypothetical protein